MMCAVQIFPRGDAHELFFNLGRGLAAGETSAVGDAKDVRIHGDRPFAEDFHQHDVRGFSTDAGERFERFAIQGDLTLMLINQCL